MTDIRDMFSPAAQARRNVPRNPQPVCHDFQPQPAPAEFWCSTCRWNKPLHDMEEHRTAISAELERLTTAPNSSAVDRG